MKGDFSPNTHQYAFIDKVPWTIILFLTAAFFLVSHDWYISLTTGNGSSISLGDYTELVDQGNILRRVVFFSLGVGAVFSYVFQRERYRVKIYGILGWLILFFISWALLSITWADDPDICLRRLVLLVMLCLVAFAVSRSLSLHDIILWVFISSIFYLHLGLVAEVVLGTFHPLLEGYRFAGTLHPNSQAINCTLLFFASLFMLKKGTRLRWFLIAIACESFIFLYLTKSRTSLGFAFIAPMLYWFMTLSLSRKGAVILCATFASCILLLFRDFFFPILGHAITLGRGDTTTMTLTGRIPLWNEMLRYIYKRPLQGYGYDSFWTSRHIAEIAKEQDWVVTQGHSTYLDLCLSLGFTGATFYVLIWVVAIRRTLIYHKESHNTVYTFLGIVLVFIFLNGLLESITIATNQITFLSMLIMARLAFPSSRAVNES